LKNFYFSLITSASFGNLKINVANIKRIRIIIECYT